MITPAPPPNTSQTYFGRLRDPHQVEELTIDIPISSLCVFPRPGGARVTEGQIVYEGSIDREGAGAVISYGPYIRLECGQYQIRLTGRLHGEFNIRLTADCGANLITDNRISSADEIIMFSIGHPIENFEIMISRLHQSKSLALSHISLTGTASVSLDRKRRQFLAISSQLRQEIKDSDRFKAANIFMYDGEITSNLDWALKLFGRSGSQNFLKDMNIRTVADIGGSNGDLAFIFSFAGFDATLIDLSLPWGMDAPLIASIGNKLLDANVRVCNLNVDRYFDFEDIRNSVINEGEFNIRDQKEAFDLGICFGLLYHIKNPFALLESLSTLTRFLVLGTFCMSNRPDDAVKIAHIPFAYLQNGEWNDSSNYWILTPAAFRRIVERCGFEIITGVTEFQRSDQLSNSFDVESKQREFLLLRSTRI